MTMSALGVVRSYSGICKIGAVPSYSGICKIGAPTDDNSRRGACDLDE